MKNLNKLNENNPENINKILPSKNIDLNINLEWIIPIMSSQRQLNYNLNYQIISQKDMLGKNDITEVLQQNNNNIEQNQDNENEQQKKEIGYEKADPKDPYISYNKFDFPDY